MAFKIIRTKNVVSKLHGEDSYDIRNNVHSTKGANKIGYKQPLISGVEAFSYGYSLILDGFNGYEFLENGYCKLKLLRPMFPNRNIRIAIKLEPVLSDPTSFKLDYVDDETEKVYIQAQGQNFVNSQFIKDHVFKSYTMPKTKIDDMEYSKLLNQNSFGIRLSKATGNDLCGRYLKIMQYKLSKKDSIEYAKNVARDENVDTIHIGILLNFMNNIIDDTYPYYPAIHTQSEIQFINGEYKDIKQRMSTDQTFKSYGKIVKIWRKKNNYYALIHGIITNEKNESIALIKHRTIYDFDAKSKL